MIRGVAQHGTAKRLGQFVPICALPNWETRETCHNSDMENQRVNFFVTTERHMRVMTGAESFAGFLKRVLRVEPMD